MPDRDDPPYEGLVEWEPGEPLVLETAPPPVRRVPWHRNPRVLLGLIITAVVPLVVASVLLMAGGSFDDDEVRLRPTLRTSSARVSPPGGPRESGAPTTSETGPETTGERPGSGAVGAPGTSVAEPELSASPAAEPDEPTKPRVAVTRTPMSFTPGQTAGR